MSTQADGVNQLRGINQNLAELTSQFGAMFALNAFSGTFTAANAATTTVTDANVTATSAIFIFPTNAAGGTLMGSAKSFYLSARTAGTSFTVTTADANSAAGTETFVYIIVNVG